MDFHLQLGGGFTNLERRDGRGSYTYPTLGFVAGLDIPVMERENTFLRSGYLSLDAAYGRLQSGSQTLGSHEDQFGLRVGYRQTFQAGSLRFFLNPRVGIDFDWSSINFGSAHVPLPEDLNLTVHVSVPVGVGYCFGAGSRPCLSLLVSPFYRRTLVAEEISQALGVLLGLELLVESGSTIPASRYEDLSQQQQSLRTQHSITQERAETLQAEQERLQAELAQSTAQRDQARSVVEQLGAGSRQLRASLLAERNRSSVDRLLENPIRNTVLSFGAEMARLSLQEVRSRGRLRSRLAMALNPLVDYLLAHPETRIRIHGHASLSGSTEFNRNLSLRRAQAVASYLRSRGIRAEQIISVEGRGFDLPLPYPENPVHPLNQSVTFEEVQTP